MRCSRAALRCSGRSGRNSGRRGGRQGGQQRAARCPARLAPTPPPPACVCCTGLGDTSAAAPKLKISPDLVAKMYEDWVMPLTKEVEVLYLLQRLGGGSSN